MVLPSYVPQWYIWVLAGFLPYIENFIINSKWRSVWKFLFAVGFSGIVAVGAAYLGSQLTPFQFDASHIVIYMGTVFTVAQGFYDSIWKKILP
jgi:hypothetical protein